MSTVATAEPVDLEELLRVAEEAARVGAAELVSRAGDLTALRVDSKTTATDPVSEADLAAERAIREVLARRVPDDGIVGEEGDDVVGTTGRRWVVDPLDGTVNFLYGIPQWCVSVACEGLVGVVLDPLRGELFAATAGGPATLDGEPLEPRPAPEGGLGHALVHTGFGYAAEVRREQATIVSRLLPAVRDLRRAGSAALDLAWVAAGRGDAYFEYGVKAWDTAAGEVIARAVGLRVERLEPFGALQPGILVAPPALIDELRALVGPVAGA
ncbi:Inositol-1-monophosphatase [Patulibacter medicamentivorans]|uniref:Inositol-1-monophosphatase n=1 Tax=Patulibacter medicamentivorans TaxID=1097667 RepID=H0E4B3_9ACTN|nr:inositol monophosphatase family protein [Patulibacter medicamentivorans]EHN11482.1 Inositol-1-monophosphatase [Patulibacter medicamentivorans]